MGIPKITNCVPVGALCWQDRDSVNVGDLWRGGLPPVTQSTALHLGEHRGVSDGVVRSLLHIGAKHHANSIIGWLHKGGHLPIVLIG